VRHLTGCFVGNSRRSPSNVKCWQRLDQLQWIARDDNVDEAVAVSADLASFCLRTRGLKDCQSARLGKFLRGTLRSHGNNKAEHLHGWRLVAAPADAAARLAAPAGAVQAEAAVVGVAVGEAAVATDAPERAAQDALRADFDALKEDRDQLLDQTMELQDELHATTEDLERVTREREELAREGGELARKLAESELQISGLHGAIAAMESAAPVVGDLTRTMEVMAKAAKAKAEASTLVGQLELAELRIKELVTEQAKERFRERHASDFMSTGQLGKGDELREQLSTKQGAKTVLQHPTSEGANLLTTQRINQLAAHVEMMLFGSGAGDLSRTQLILAAVLDRPVVQRLLANRWQSPKAAAAAEASKAMLDSARRMLEQLGSKQRGSRELPAHLAFETILMALLPDNAEEEKLLGSIGSLLGLDCKAVQRAAKRKREAAEGGASSAAITQALPGKRMQRKDARGWGRRVAAAWWHEYTRMDTNPRRKKRIRIGPSKYKEHWRHISYDTNEEMAKRCATTVPAKTKL
jgi:hypothetical protein